MKKYIIVLVLLTLLASCSNDSAVNNPSSTDFNDNIILTKLPRNDSVTHIYGYELSSNKLRYITDLGLNISNVYYNKTILVKLGYYSLREINVFDIKSKTFIQIPQGSDYPMWAVISQDAKKVAYTTDPDNLLVVFNADGTNRRIFSTDIRGTEYLVEFSPDGKQIAFVEKNSSYNSAIYTIDTSGNNKFKVVDISEPNSSDRLAWSPDSKSIVFANKTTSIRNNIWKVNFDGSGLVNLTNYEFGESYPVYSPDGQYIAFVRYGSSGISDIMYMKSDGSGTVNLTNTPTEHESYPAWSPDSKKLSFMKSYDYGSTKRMHIFDITSQNYVYIDSIFYSNWNYTK